MKNVILVIIGLILMCFGLIFFVVFKNNQLGIFLMSMSFILQIINVILIIKKRI